MVVMENHCITIVDNKNNATIGSTHLLIKFFSNEHVASAVIHANIPSRLVFATPQLFSQMRL